jgi:signal transduction histidine kinase
MADAVNKPQTPPDETILRPAARALLQKLSDVSGSEYFQKLSEALCASLAVDIAIVGKIIDDGAKVQTLGMTWDGKPAKSITYDLTGTPCYNTVRNNYCLHRDNVQGFYPDDQMLIDENIQGYAGYPLRDENGQTIGLIIALSRQPISVDREIFDFAKIAAARARAELQAHIAQEKLKKALNEALLLNYSKSMFMANISHELRNPLSAMIGYASLIRDRQVEKQNITEYANEICLAGEELLALISDILSLSTLEISGDTAERKEFDLTEIARTGRRLLQEQAAAKNLTLLPVLRAEPLCVIGDSKHTKKALLNLITNAVKFTSMGQIEIIVGTNDKGEAFLAVQDTGIGMDDDQIAEACRGMDSFENAYSMHKNGHGLGLPLTYLLIERQGGHIEIESKKGRDSGTIVRLIFPKENVTGEKSDFI